MKQNLWKKGREDYKTFSDIPLKGFNSTLAFLLSLVLTIITVLPLIILIYQLYFILGYHRLLLRLLIIISWLMLLFCNGLSNYFTLELTKHYYPNEPKLQKLSSKAIFVYQSLNIGFAVATFIILFTITNIIK